MYKILQVVALNIAIIIANTFPAGAFSSKPINLLLPLEYHPTWEISTEVSSIDISQNIVASIAAVQLIADPMGSSLWSGLFLRCQEGVTQVYVVFNDQRLSDEGEHGIVDLRVDTGKPFERNMLVSHSGDALGMWSGHSPIRFIRSLQNAETLVVRVKPIDRGPIVATFDVRDIEAAITPISAACGWSVRSIWDQLTEILAPY